MQYHLRINYFKFFGIIGVLHIKSNSSNMWRLVISYFFLRIPSAFQPGYPSTQFAQIHLSTKNLKYLFRRILCCFHVHMQGNLVLQGYSKGNRAVYVHFIFTPAMGKGIKMLMTIGYYFIEF